jgi:hypothetical protein
MNLEKLVKELDTVDVMLLVAVVVLLYIAFSRKYDFMGPLPGPSPRPPPSPPTPKPTPSPEPKPPSPEPKPRKPGLSSAPSCEPCDKVQGCKISPDCECPPGFALVYGRKDLEPYCIPSQIVCGEKCHVLPDDNPGSFENVVDATTCALSEAKPPYPDRDHFLDYMGSPYNPNGILPSTIAGTNWKKEDLPNDLDECWGLWSKHIYKFVNEFGNKPGSPPK